LGTIAVDVPTGRSVSFSTAVIRFIVEVSEKSKNDDFGIGSVGSSTAYTSSAEKEGK
jgi:hypothetical protein